MQGRSSRPPGPLPSHPGSSGSGRGEPWPYGLCPVDAWGWCDCGPGVTLTDKIHGQDRRVVPACYLGGTPRVGVGMKNRRSIRRPGHDYAAPGHYFVTVCVRNRDPLLGVADGEAVTLSEMGLIVQDEWQGLPERFPRVRLDVFRILPNHLHGIITIVGAPLAGARPVDQPDGVDRGDSEATRCGLPTVRAGASPAPTLGTIIGAFKSLSDRRCRETAVAADPGRRFGCLWQRNYHDHVIADEDERERIKAYIQGNVSDWRNDPVYAPPGHRNCTSQPEASPGRTAAHR